jgi:hypothetical protein
MARNNLSLGNLYRAVSGSARTSQQASIGQFSGNAANSSLLGFAADLVTVTVPTFTYIVESTTENAQFSFSTTGSLFYSKVQQVTNNYTCSFNNANFTAGSRTYATGPTIVPLTPAAISVSTYSEAQSVLTMKYEDGYNVGATNYGAVTTKTLYAVDVYNTINQPDFCLLFDTPITKGDNTIVNVEDLAVGDIIKAWVPAGLPDESLDGTDTGETEWRMFNSETAAGEYQDVTVSDITFNFATGYYNINNGLIKATGTHPLYVFDFETQKYHFKSVETILPGDSVLTYDETNGLVEVLVYDVARITEDVEIVTLNVENADVYLANGVVSHNKGTTTQPYIPSSGLRLYLEPAKTASFASATLPATGTPTVDVLDMSGYNTGVRPAFTGQFSGSATNPSYNNGASRKERYYAFNGTNQFLYKDKDSNINGGFTQFNTNTGTIHIWVRPTTTLGTTSRMVFDYAGFFGLAVESSNSSTLDRVKFYGSSLGNSSQFTTSLSSNVWYMLSVAFQPSGTTTVYVDGVSVGSFSAAAFTAPSSTNFITIGSNSGRTSFWNGQIGPVLFYNTLQTLALVDQVYDYFSPNYK